MSQTIDRKKLDTFLSRCLEPLALGLATSEERRIARKMKSGERSRRLDVWHKAMLEADYFAALYKASEAERIYRLFVDKGVPQRIHPGNYLDRYRAALAAQLLAPAVRQSDIRWKQSARKDKHLPINQEAIDQAIADDEAYLLRRKGGAEEGGSAHNGT
jgi:hypothetical protein